MDIRGWVAGELTEFWANKLGFGAGCLKWLGVAAAMIFIVGAPLLVLQASKPDRPIGESIREIDQDVRFIVIGNSIADTRIDPVELEQIVTDGRTVKLQSSASKPALWYLRLKNEVVASVQRPQTVLFFFQKR